MTEPSESSYRADHASEAVNELSPLLSAAHTPLGSDDLNKRSRLPAHNLDWQEEDGDRQETKSTWYLFLLTLSIGGLQIAWSVEMSNGSPFLLTLGMSKSLLALVWIAGPLSGALVQPYVGIRSDNCRLPWGKRRPFMVGGAAATIVSLLALAWTKPIVTGICGIFGAHADSDFVKTSAICFAIVFVYLLDFAINTVQAGIRAFMVDNAPTHQQEDANAWAGRITGVGNILGYLSGYVELPKIVPFLGDTQFKVLCVIASVALGGTVLISSFSIQERDPRLEGPPSKRSAGLLSFFQQVVRSMSRLPPQIRRVCEVQFFNWIGWFPFLFYITTYIGQLKVNPIFESHPNMTPHEIEEEWKHATRVGTFALLIFAIISFTASMLLPFIIVPTYRPPPETRHNATPPLLSARPPTPTTPSGMSTMSGYFPPASTTAAAHSRIAHLVNACQIRWLTLRRAWLLSHLLFALCMFLTFFVRTPAAGTVLVGLIGLPWALSLWAPFALISAEISKREAAQRQRRQRRRHVVVVDDHHLNHHHLDHQDARPVDEEEPEDQAGVILGLHNVAIAAPQIVATLVSSVIFKLAQRPRGVAGDDSVGWVLRFGGCAALVAAYMTSRIGEASDGDLEVGDATGEDERL